MARQHSRSSREYRSSREHTSREYTTEKPRRRSRQNSTNGRRDDRGQSLPQYNHNGHAVTKGIHPDGESGRRGFHPFRFLKIAFKSSSTLSMMVNLLWPVVPVAIALVRFQSHRQTGVKVNTNVALCEARMEARHLHHQLHRYGSCCQHARIRWPGTFSQDAPESHSCRPRNDTGLCC